MALLGTVEGALANTTVVRLYHSDAPNFPNPGVPIPTIAAMLGVDNIAVTAQAVPEPASLTLLGLAFVSLAGRRRQRG